MLVENGLSFILPLHYLQIYLVATVATVDMVDTVALEVLEVVAHSVIRTKFLIVSLNKKTLILSRTIKKIFYIDIFLLLPVCAHMYV
jgi:hypothetical protein